MENLCEQNKNHFSLCTCIVNIRKKKEINHMLIKAISEKNGMLEHVETV